MVHVCELLCEQQLMVCAAGSVPEIALRWLLWRG